MDQRQFITEHYKLIVKKCLLFKRKLNALRPYIHMNDFIQEVCLAMLTTTPYDSTREGADPGAYAYVVARSVYNYLSGKKRDAMSHPSKYVLMEDIYYEPASIYAEPDDDVELYAFVEALPTDLKELVNLIIEGHSNESIRSLLGLSKEKFYLSISIIRDRIKEFEPQTITD